MPRLLPLALAMLAAVSARGADLTVSPEAGAGPAPAAAQSMAALPPAWQQQLGPLLASPDVSAPQLQAALSDLQARSPLEGAAAARGLGELALELRPSLGERAAPLAQAAASARARLDEAQRLEIDRALRDTALRLGLPSETTAVDGAAAGPESEARRLSRLAPSTHARPKTGQDGLVLAPDLGAEVRALQREILGDARMAREARTNLALRAMRTQMLTHLQHVSFTYKIRDNTYTHDLVIDGAYPKEATELAIAKAREFLRLYNAGAKLPLPSFPRGAETEAAILAEQKAFIKKLTNDPLATYLDMRARLTGQGVDAPFPEELGPVVRHLALKLLDDPQLAEHCEQDALLWNFRASALERLAQVADPMTGPPYPYMKTVEAIQYAVEFFDVYQRAIDPTRSPVLYHSARYEYYGHYLKGQAPDHIVMPTIVSLGATDILKTRGVPIGLVGVNTDITWVDGFYQTPYEFWVHDINHSRRMYQFFKETAQARGLTIEQFARESDAFIREKLMPLIAVRKGDTDVVKNKKRLLKVLLFEILHEDALAAALDVVKTAVLRPPNLITPFERIDGDVVSYVMEPGATTLAYTYRKLAHDFYDMPGARLDNIVAPEYRTRENIVEAAETLMHALGAGSNRKVLEYFVSTDVGFPKDFKSTVARDIQARPGETVALDQEETAGKDNARAIVADLFQAAWQKNSGYPERWKPARTAFKDGRGVNDDFRIETQEQLDEYFAEKGIPDSLKRYFSFRIDRESGLPMLHEDIQHLPNHFLAANNQYENLKGASHAVDLIESIREQKLHFSNVGEATAWLTDSFQALNAGWQRRNWWWAKDYPEYNHPWNELAAGKQLNGVMLLKLALETETQLDPNAVERSQKTLLLEALRRLEVQTDRKRRVEVRAAAAGRSVHENWRSKAPYAERWKPAFARLDDGTPVATETLLAAYLDERKVPQALRRYFAFKPDEKGAVVLQEDLKNLPYEYLSARHQEENLESGRAAVDIVDRVWGNRLVFKDLDAAERWLRAAASQVHEGVLARNINGARDSPVYNQRWDKLPSRNQRLDLDLVRSAFKARFSLQPDQMPESQQRLILSAIDRLDRELSRLP